MIINLVTPSSDFSEDENRKLAAFPKITASSLTTGKFSEEFDSYYSDQFFLRNVWVRLNFFVNYVFGKRCFSDVYIGKNGYLFSKPAEPDEVKNKETADAINRFAEKHADKNTVFVMVPDSASVLKDSVPSDLSLRDQHKDVEDFCSMLDPKIKIADTYSALSDHADDYIYYKTDHHWTSLGARYVFMEAAMALGIQDDENYQMLLVTDSFEGTLASKSGDHMSKDEIYVFMPNEDIKYIVNIPDIGFTSASLYIRDNLEVKDKYTVFLGGNYSLVEVSTTASSGKRLLLFKDSYANCFLPFLLPYYEKIILIDPRYYYDNVEAVISNYDITDVMYLYSADTLLQDTVLKDTLGN